MDFPFGTRAVFYTDQSPLFFRKIAHNERYRRPSRPEAALSTLRAGDCLGSPRPALPLSTFESNYKMAASEAERSISTVLRGKGGCKQSINVITDCN